MLIALKEIIQLAKKSAHILLYTSNRKSYVCADSPILGKDFLLFAILLLYINTQDTEGIKSSISIKYNI